MVEHTFSKDFKYRHKNPYHDKLEAFDGFVFRDHEAEVFQGKWNSEVFKKDAKLCVEIGSGYGHFMLEYCENNPDLNFVGMDYRFKRSFELAKRLAKHPNKNFRYLRARGERIPFMFEESEVDEIYYFFPDPWPKKRHWKKRLFQRPFLECAYKVLKPGATLFVKTDHAGYADWMANVLRDQDLFEVQLATNNLWKEHPEHFLTSFETKFEKIFLGQGVKINGFVLTSKKEANGN